jgi:hypothetical protein
MSVESTNYVYVRWINQVHPIEIVEVALTDLLLSATRIESVDATTAASEIRETGEELKRIKNLCQ